MDFNSRLAIVFLRFSPTAKKNLKASSFRPVLYAQLFVIQYSSPEQQIGVWSEQQLKALLPPPSLNSNERASERASMDESFDSLFGFSCRRHKQAIRKNSNKNGEGKNVYKYTWSSQVLEFVHRLSIDSLVASRLGFVSTQPRLALTAGYHPRKWENWKTGRRTVLRHAKAVSEARTQTKRTFSTSERCWDVGQ